MAAAYLEKCQSYALYIKYQGSAWMEYVRRFEEYEEAVKESVRLISETDSVLRMKVEPVSYLRLTAFTPLEPNFDHFEALKDFVATNPEVAIPPEAMSALKDVLEEHCTKCGAQVDENCDGDLNDCPRHPGGIESLIGRTATVTIAHEGDKPPHVTGVDLDDEIPF